jgi:hypothetical protein
VGLAGEEHQDGQNSGGEQRSLDRSASDLPQDCLSHQVLPPLGVVRTKYFFTIVGRLRYLDSNYSPLIQREMRVER